MSKFKIPPQVSHVTETLQKAGFEAYLVGGCVRDMVREANPTDWDITTNATPEEIMPLFEETHRVVYENDFGTVFLVNEDEDTTSPTREIQVTPYRLETTYSNKRHPDQVEFSTSLEDDLKRRDFTINAMAYDPQEGKLVDLYNGQKDIKDKVIQTVGDPHERFNEDALRMMRAVRFTAQLNFGVSHETREAIGAHAQSLTQISVERIRDEFIKMIGSSHPMEGLLLMEKLDLLQYIIPELEEGIGQEQNNDHIYDVWTHLLKSLQNAANKEWPLHVRLAALFHDIGKPRTRRYEKEKNDYTFYGHEVVGAKMTRDIMKRLKFPKDLTETVTKLVRWHMFFSDIDQITLSAVRRIIKNVGGDNVWDLMKVRKCDRIGMGRPKEEPYKLRKYESMIEEAMRDPVSVQQLKINGDIMVGEMNMNPGIRMGWILHALLEEVLDDPSKNELEYQKNRATELDKLSDDELQKLGEAGKEARDEAEEAELKDIRGKYHVK